MGAHRTHRSDGNSDEIVNALRGQGASVEYINHNGKKKGIPDLIAGLDGYTMLVEVKMPGEKLSPEQIDFHAKWRGAPIAILRTLEDVGALVAGIRQREPRLDAAAS